jgi:hypothetical protein
MAAAPANLAMRAELPVWMQAKCMACEGQKGFAESAAFTRSLWLLCIYFVTDRHQFAASESLTSPNSG